jgi:spore coat protein CotF
MPYGAHETMEVHEMLTEKINLIDHFAMYLRDCQNAELRHMIENHLNSAIASYNQLVSYTHDYSAANRFQPAYGMPDVQPQQIMYGLRHPAPQAPHLEARFDDRQIAASVLCMHKSSAKNHMAASLESADPNVRHMLMDASMTCANQAYETFLFMNRQGYYQVPTMDAHTAKTYLHSYQPVGYSMEPTAQPMPQNMQQTMPQPMPHIMQQTMPQPVLQPIRQPVAQQRMEEDASRYFDGMNAPMNNVSQAVAQSMMGGPGGGTGGVMHQTSQAAPSSSGYAGNPSATYRPMQNNPAGSFARGPAPGAIPDYARQPVTGNMAPNPPGRLQ